MLKNTKESFGFISKTLHWLMAVLLIGLFAVGLYMTELDYYDSLYHTLPWWHKSIGLSVMVLLIFRFIWKLSQADPAPLKTHKSWEVFLAHLIQRLFYGLILLIGISGYFISTAKGKGIEFFNLFEVPAIMQALEEDRADLIGEIHEILAITLIVFAALHALAALKHHFIDKDETLLRMINK
ncbi:MAG TPA: cytochrome b [Leucothrix sp.]|nr:cytochrome b [Leucothrix sp.]